MSLNKYRWANKNNGNINIPLSSLPWTLRIKSRHQGTNLTCFDARADNLEIACELKVSPMGILTIKFDQPPSARTDLAKLFEDTVW